MATFSFNTRPGLPRQHRPEAEGQVVGFAPLTGWMDGSSTPPDTPCPVLIPVSTLPPQVLAPPTPSIAAGAGGPFGFL